MQRPVRCRSPLQLYIQLAGNLRLLHHPFIATAKVKDLPLKNNRELTKKKTDSCDQSYQSGQHVNSEHHEIEAMRLGDKVTNNYVKYTD